MQDPDRENCQVCGKSLKKTSMKKHLANVHGKAAQDKKQLKANRESAKKQALQAATKEIFTNQDYGKGTISDTSQRNSYAVPANFDDKKMAEVALILEDFEFIEESPKPAKKVAPGQPIVKKRQQLELAIQRKLEKQYGGTHKIIHNMIIDVLTPHEVIEIKHWKDWIKAVGQCTVYCHFFPNHMKHIHFFGEPPKSDDEILIRMICAKHAIRITQEPWP